MSLLELAQSRYSVRDYQPTPVSDDDLQYILESARLAPSACNRQPWHFYLCTSADALSKVQKCYDREWFRTAPMVIICCIDHGGEWVRQSDRHAHGIVDISIAAEHICLAATERGLGTCWVCNFDAQLCHQLFHLPDQYEAAILLPLGHPNTVPTEKKRCKMSEILTIL